MDIVRSGNTIYGIGTYRVRHTARSGRVVALWRTDRVAVVHSHKVLHRPKKLRLLQLPKLR